MPQHLWCLVSDGASTGSAAVALPCPEALTEAKVTHLGAVAALRQRCHITGDLLPMLQASSGLWCRLLGSSLVLAAVAGSGIAVVQTAISLLGKGFQQPLHLCLAVLLHLLVMCAAAVCTGRVTGGPRRAAQPGALLEVLHSYRDTCAWRTPVRIWRMCRLQYEPVLHLLGSLWHARGMHGVQRQSFDVLVTHLCHNLVHTSCSIVTHPALRHD